MDRWMNEQQLCKQKNKKSQKRDLITDPKKGHAKETLYKKKEKNTLKITSVAGKEWRWYFIYIKTGVHFNKNLLPKKEAKVKGVFTHIILRLMCE